MKFYSHVDRLHSLKAGDVIDKTVYRGECVLPMLMPFADEDFLRHLDKLSKDGLSSHGARYLLKPGLGVGNEVRVTDFLLELQFEYVRHIYYKSKPSRLQSLFAFDSYEEAERFKAQTGGRGVICEIDAYGLCFIANRNHLKIDADPDAQKHRAMAYWEGQRFSFDEHYSPDAEYLLELPARVLYIHD